MLVTSWVSVCCLHYCCGEKGAFSRCRRRCRMMWTLLDRITKRKLAMNCRRCLVLAWTCEAGKHIGGSACISCKRILRSLVVDCQSQLFLFVTCWRQLGPRLFCYDSSILFCQDCQRVCFLSDLVVSEKCQFRICLVAGILFGYWRVIRNF